MSWFLQTSLSYFKLLAVYPLLALTGCMGSDSSSGVAKLCYGYDESGSATSYNLCRVFKGRLQFPSAKELTLPNRPFQILALGFEPRAETPGAVGEDGSVGSLADAGVQQGVPTKDVTPRFFYGTPFTSIGGAGQRPTVPFSVVVPCQISINLLLQIVRTSSDFTPGIQVAPMSFAPAEGSAVTTLIPWQSEDYCGEKTNQLDLGDVTLTMSMRGDLTSGTITLGKGNSKNPLTLFPPPEGQVNEQDTDGDGIIDSAQTFKALPDSFTPGRATSAEEPQGDGIPDMFQ
jgi:hypothetical protein